MQEEIENRAVTLIVSTSRLTARGLARAVSAFLRHKQSKKQTKKSVKAQKKASEKAEKRYEKLHPRGQMTVKQLAGQGKGMQSIEVTKENIGGFTKTANRYGIDFALKKQKGTNKYYVFFKAPDADALTVAFKEFTKEQLKREKRPSVRKVMKTIAETYKDVFKDLIGKDKKPRTPVR